MPNFKKNPEGMKPSGFKMKGYTYPGTSPMQNGNKPKVKMLEGTTIFGHEVSKIKEKVVKKAKKLGRKAELLFESGIYSNKYQAENPGRFSKSKINQPRFKAEKKELLKK